MKKTHENKEQITNLLSLAGQQIHQIEDEIRTLKTMEKVAENQLSIEHINQMGEKQKIVESLINQVDLKTKKAKELINFN